jgi:glutathione S-transferase/RNA polymerase-associated protein
MAAGADELGSTGRHRFRDMRFAREATRTAPEKQAEAVLQKETARFPVSPRGRIRQPRRAATRVKADHPEDAMITLYEHPLSPYVQKVKIALREKDIPFDVTTPGAIGSGTAAGAFVAANPRAEVPALVDGDLAIFDSTVILEYIEDKWPTPALLPATPADRARVRMIEDVMDTQFEAINWGLGEIHRFRRAEGALADAMNARAATQSAGYFAWLERELGGRPWFNGAGFGWGDLSVVPYLNSAAAFGNVPAQGSPLSAWLDRVNARQYVAITAKEARDSLAGMAHVARIIASGRFKREYRDHRLEWMVKSGGMAVVLAGLEDDNIRFSADFR